MKPVFNHTGHQKLWNWLAENPGKIKGEWLEWRAYYSVSYGCFACDYACKLSIEITGKHTAGYRCKHCPLVWGTKNCFNNGLYFKWDICNDPIERKKMAEAIRDLPVRDGVECI